MVLIDVGETLNLRFDINKLFITNFCEYSMKIYI